MSMDRVDVFELLRADGPLPEHREKLMLYGQFVGSWDVESSWYAQGQLIRTAKGEWHFQWILGGWGVQDVLFPAGAPSHKYGTSLRCYDRELDAWHITWMQPYGGEYVNLLARREGERIVQEGAGAAPGRRERWSFDRIRPESFLWTGEASRDGGKSWVFEQEMRATRRARG
jgi:hypothetical protein